MIDFETALHQVVRSKYCTINQETALASTADYATKQSIYYTKRLEDNLYQDMDLSHFAEFSRGQGGELRETDTYGSRPMKMKSVRSSSALAFNTFGNCQVKIKSNSFGLPSKVYKITYEKPHRLIKSDNRDVSAWVDVVLLSSDEEDCIIVESKMFEWLLNKPKPISEKYLSEELYISQQVGHLIIPTIKQLLSGEEIIKEGRKSYIPINDQYDGIQILLHTIGFLTERQLGNYKNVKRVHIVNMIWTLHDKDLLGMYSNKYNEFLEKEQSQSHLFKEYFDKYISTIFNKLYGVEATFNAVEHYQIVNSLDINKNHKDYLLSRY